jgi:hypothetical protein
MPAAVPTGEKPITRFMRLSLYRAESAETQHVDLAIAVLLSRTEQYRAKTGPYQRHVGRISDLYHHRIEHQKGRYDWTEMLGISRFCRIGLQPISSKVLLIGPVRGEMSRLGSAIAVAAGHTAAFPSRGGDTLMRHASDFDLTQLAASGCFAAASPSAIRLRFQRGIARRTMPLNFCTASARAANFLIHYRCRLSQMMCCVALGLLIGGKAAWASFITLDDPTFGANALVLDTSTGLEWLNARFSIGLSPGQVTADLQPGGEFAGFRYATEQEYVSSTTAFFGFTSPQDGLNNFFLDQNAAEDFISLFGPTFSDFGLPALSGYYGPEISLSGTIEACIGTVQPFGAPGYGYTDRQCYFGLRMAMSAAF